MKDLSIQIWLKTTTPNYIGNLGDLENAFWRLSCSEITLHTDISYNGKNSKVKSFYTVSESMDHNSAA